MAQFDDREKAQEAMFAHNSEMRFKAEARRNKLLGHWAAGQMGLSGQSEADYVSEVIAADFQEAGDEDVFRKIAGDLKGKGVAVAADVIRKKMRELMDTARAQVSSEA